MKRCLIKEYNSKGTQYKIYKSYLTDGVEYQVYKDDIPVSIKVTASYQKIADYHHYRLPDLDSTICEFLESDIDKGLLRKTT